MVLVRITTDDGNWPDQECILTPLDWSELEHNSTVAFSTCKFGPALAALEAAIQRGMFQQISSPPPNNYEKSSWRLIHPAGCRQGLKSSWDKFDRKHDEIVVFWGCGFLSIRTHAL